MATNKTNVTSNSPNSSEKEESTVTYVFLASRLYPFGLSDAVKTDEKGQLTKTDGKQIMALDVTTRFSNSWEGDLTKYPISSGSEITDHISIRNNKYTLEGVISDTPFEKHDSEFFGGYPTGSYRAMAAVETLEKMFKDKKTFTLFSEYQQIDNAIITSIKFEQEGALSVRFTMEMEQVRFAYAKTVNLKVSASTKKTVAPNQNGGGSSKQTADGISEYERKVAEAKKTNAAANK